MTELTNFEVIDDDQVALTEISPSRCPSKRTALLAAAGVVGILVVVGVAAGLILLFITTSKAPPLNETATSLATTTTLEDSSTTFSVTHSSVATSSTGPLTVTSTVPPGTSSTAPPTASSTARPITTSTESPTTNSIATPTTSSTAPSSTSTAPSTNPPSTSTAPSTAPTSTSTAPSTTPPPASRLPKNVLPLNYTVLLAPYLYTSNKSALYFRGSVQIRVAILDSANFVRLHVHPSIQVDSYRVYSSEREYEIANVTSDEKLQWTTLTLQQPLPPDSTATIDVANFKGQLITSLFGLYVSGDDEAVAATQTRPTGVRRMFPCFDEPALTAAFDVGLVRCKDFSAFANTKSRRNVSVDAAARWGFNDAGDCVLEEFEQTPTMPTQMLAVAVAKVSANWKENDDLRCWTRLPESEVGLCDFTLETVANFSHFFRSYFDREFPLGKLDLLASPQSIEDLDVSDGFVGWGLAIGSERLLLMDSRRDGIVEESRASFALAAGISRAWTLSNLGVSWWDDGWFDEGMAGYTAIVCLQQQRPQLQPDVAFVAEQMRRAFLDDSTVAGVVPLAVGIGGGDSALVNFDGVASRKATAVVRHSFHSSGGRTRFVDDFAQRPGHPLLDCSVDGSVVTVTQSRFVLSAEDARGKKDDDDDDEFWTMPIFRVTSVNVKDFDPQQPSKLSLILASRQANLTLEEDSEWYLLNLMSIGFYRVNYDAENWRRLARQLSINHEVFTPQDRVRLIEDAFAIAEAGDLDYGLAMQLTTFLVNETNFGPWQSALHELWRIRHLLESEEDKNLLEKFAQQLLTPAYQNVGFVGSSDDSESRRRLRSVVVDFSCRFNVGDCRQQAATFFQQLSATNFTDEDVRVPADMRPLILCSGVAYGPTANWEAVFSRLHVVFNKPEGERLAGAVVCVHDLIKIISVVGFISDHAKEQPRLALAVLDSIGEMGMFDAVGLLVVPMEMHLRHSQLLSRLLRPYEWMTTENGLSDLQQLRAAANPDPGSQVALALERTEARVKLNIRWSGRHRQTVVNWLSDASKMNLSRDES